MMGLVLLSSRNDGFSAVFMFSQDDGFSAVVFLKQWAQFYCFLLVIDSELLSYRDEGFSSIVSRGN